MNISAAIREQTAQFEPGVLFSTEQFLSLGSREAIDQALSRLVGQGAIARLARGIFARPKKSKYAGTVLPSATEVVSLIAEQNIETIQLHGAEAARQLGLSTQMPMQLVYHTNGPSRTIQVTGQPVKFVRTANQRLLQHSGTKVGLAISALFYLGKEEVTEQTIQTIKQKLTSEEFQLLVQSKLPAWLQVLLQQEVTKSNG